LEKAEKERKLELSSGFVSTRDVIENSKKIVKKLKNSIMASFQARIGWERPRKRENKYCRSVLFRSNPTSYRKFPKKSKKNSKNKKYRYGLISSQNRLGKAEKEEK